MTDNPTTQMCGECGEDVSVSYSAEQIMSLDIGSGRVCVEIEYRECDVEGMYHAEAQIEIPEGYALMEGTMDDGVYTVEIIRL